MKKRILLTSSLLCVLSNGFAYGGSNEHHEIPERPIYADETRHIEVPLKQRLNPKNYWRVKKERNRAKKIRTKKLEKQHADRKALYGAKYLSAIAIVNCSSKLIERHFMDKKDKTPIGYHKGLKYLADLKNNKKNEKVLKSIKKKCEKTLEKFKKQEKKGLLVREQNVPYDTRASVDKIVASHFSNSKKMLKLIGSTYYGGSWCSHYKGQGGTIALLVGLSFKSMRQTCESALGRREVFKEKGFALGVGYGAMGNSNLGSITHSGRHLESSVKKHRWFGRMSTDFALGLGVAEDLATRGRSNEIPSVGLGGFVGGGPAFRYKASELYPNFDPIYKALNLDFVRD